ncbi:MAG: methionyl-tRNA formyltransferase [Bacteroidia bacterium]|jgi:methionyl-tRNA formyltransferase
MNTPDAPLRILFAGTPDFSATHLDTLIDSKHQLTAVLTQPDRRAGRGKKVQPSPVKQAARNAGLTVLQPASLKDPQEQAALSALDVDVMIVVAYGLILPQAVLDIPRLGCLNVHASLLPRWRGAAPIQRALEAGDDRTGITIMQMDAGLDTGAMLAICDCPIGPLTTGASLHDELAKIGPPLLLQVLSDIENRRLAGVIQDDSLATYAHKMSKAEAQLDWRADATVLDRKVRAFNPFPVCFTVLGKERVRIWQASPIPDAQANSAPGTIATANEAGIAVNCGGGQLLIQSLQLPGGKVLSASQILAARSAQFCPGARFELPAATDTP